MTSAPAPFDYGEIAPGYYDDVYRRGRGVQSKWHHLKFEAVRREVGTLAPLLDLGCGPGTFLGSIGDGRECLGLDVAAEQVEFARRVHGSASRRFETMTGGGLPVAGGTFAAATMIEVVEHLADPVPALREAVRALRPGGRLVVTTPNYASHWPLLEWLVGRLSPVDYAHQHVTKLRKTSLRGLLEAAGLSGVRVRPFLRAAPFAAALSWRLADRVARLEERVPLAPGALLLGTGEKPR